MTTSSKFQPKYPSSSLTTFINGIEIVALKRLLYMDLRVMVNFHCRVIFPRTHVNFTPINKIKSMYGKPRLNVKVERVSTVTFARELPYTDSISFRAQNLRAYAEKNYATVEIYLHSNATYGTLEINNSCTALLCLRHFYNKSDT